MSDKQLTVAELMARAAKEGRGDAPKRRRRRSLEEGGVSVAELTGSIPKVDAKPAESRHSSHPIDGPAKPPQEAKASEAASSEAPAAEKPEVKEAKAAAPAAKPAVETPAKAAEAKAAAAKADAAKTGDKPEAKSEEKKPEPKLAADKKAEDKKSTPSSDDTIVISVVDENDPVKLTTDTFPAIKPEQLDKKETEANKPAAGAKTAGAANAKTAGAAAAGAAAAGLAGAGLAGAAAKKVEDKPAEAQQTEAQPTDIQAEKSALVDVDKQADTKQVDSAQDIDGAMTPRVDSELSDDSRELEVADYEAEEDVEEGAGFSLMSVLVMTILAIAIGVGLFKGFEMLWGNLNNLLVAVLALVMTGGIIGVVHALRTERDGLSMALAGVAGLAMTFGPLLISGI